MDSNKVKSKSIISTLIVSKYLFIIVLVLIFLGLFFIGVKFSRNFVINQKTTKLGLENVGELVTQTCYTTVLEDSKVNLDFFSLFDIPLTESRQIFSYDFEVDAAVNFGDISIKKVDSKDKIITLEIPRAKVYKTTLKPDSFRVYLDSDSLFTRIDLENHNTAVLKMQDQAEADCAQNGLLESADFNAERLINSVIKSNVKYKDYTVNCIYK